MTDEEYRRKRNAELYKTPAGKALRDAAGRLDPLFNDMLPAGFYFPISEIVFYPDSTLETDGNFSALDMQISIKTKTGKNCGPVLLHEMTHLYITVLRQTPGLEEYEKALLPKLEAQARKTLPDLDAYRDDLFEILADSDFYPDEESHDELFLYKSLELDGKRRYKPGTVYGYGLEQTIALNEAIRRINADRGAQPWQPR